jgi:cGMP-dependent protein kinase
MYNNLLKWSFEKNSLLCKLTKIQVEKIVSKIETVNYEAKQNVFVSNSKCDKLVIVLEGALENVFYIYFI